MAKEAASRGRGRPSKGDDAKRHAVGIRTTRELKAQIEEAAAASGRSMAQEIEHRLEASFREEASMGGRRTANLARAIASNIATIEEIAGQRWFQHQDAWRAVLKTLPSVMYAFIPDNPDTQEVMERAVESARERMLVERSIEATNSKFISGELEQ